MSEYRPIKISVLLKSLKCNLPGQKWWCKTKIKKPLLTHTYIE